MTIIHIVLFKFKPEVSKEHKETFMHELRQLRFLSCVKDQNLHVGSPSLTDPIEKSKGFEIALVSYHPGPAALAEYQASKEHERNRVTSTYLWPYKEDVVRFDFEIGNTTEEERLGEMMAYNALKNIGC
ncbi:stress responsive A/B Barrel domain-containing protein [Verticillium dahliae]